MDLTISEMLRMNARRKSELDADKALLTRAADEIDRLTNALNKSASKSKATSEPYGKTERGE
jgi:hypothetical protein